VTDWEAVRRLAPEVLGTLVRRHGHFDACEDAVQEALLAAASQWPIEGWPDSPKGWLITVASRRLTDQLRSDTARRRREDLEVARAPWAPAAGAARSDAGADADAAWSGETLTLLVLCCHPALSPPSQVALTLRAVGGLSTAEIARAFLVPEPTMAQRITRAKQRIKATGATFERPTPAERDERLTAVLRVLYLIFNEGYTATSGATLVRAELTTEAIRLAREVHRLVPDDSEVAGLLALMLLTDARRPARTAPDGSLIPLDEQDRTRWDANAIAEGVALVTDALAHGPLGPYQLQAAIAAVHDEASSAEATDWRQILALYSLLERIAPNPMTTLNRAVALAMVEGPASGLALLERLSVDERAAASHHLTSVRAHLLELAGDHDAALAGYRQAARRTTSEPERRHLLGRAARLAT
jgi:RNA polymerase sigma factor (sigma-70 family)